MLADGTDVHQLEARFEVPRVVVQGLADMMMDVDMEASVGPSGPPSNFLIPVILAS